MKILGSVDRCDEKFVEGWITIADNTEAKLSLEFLVDGNVIGSCIADQFRQDLKDAKLGDGTCAFSFVTPPFLPKSEVKNIGVRLEHSNLFLRADTNRSTNSALSSGTISRFGGLWIDRHDFVDRLAEKHRSGRISESLSLSIFRFARDGYLVIEGAVPVNLIDELNEQIEHVWQDPPDGLRIETFEPDGKMRIISPELNLRAGRTKMLDLFAYSSLIRRVIAAPKVIEFLAAIFEDTPKAFQSLTFWKGSQQAIHKDTAYVKIDSNPMHLAATWLALEDIDVGTGELEYYVGSHRAPDFLFGGTNKWMESHTDEHDRFLNSLHEDARSLGHVKGSFLAKKGDVLIWHADLAHGGSPILQPSRTRKSLVTHFTAARDEPFYRRATNFIEAEENGCSYVSELTDISNAVIQA